MDTQDPSYMFIIEESNIEKTENIEIIETLLKDDSELVLNKLQINNELTNLLLNKYKNEKQVAHKVGIYQQLFELNNTIEFPSDIKPIILCNKLVFRDNKEIDDEFDNTYLFQSENFKNFMSQFTTYSHKSAIYTETINNIYTLFKPFKDTNSSLTFTKIKTILNQNQDVFRHFIFEQNKKNELKAFNISPFEEFRVIAPIKIDTGKRDENPDDKGKCISGLNYLTSSNEIITYKGDEIDIIGYYNKINNELPEVFDLSTYKKHIATLQKNDTIDIYFNDFAFNHNKNIVLTAQGIIESITKKIITITLNKPIFIKNIETTYLQYHIHSPNICFIYSTKYINFKYHKLLLSQKSILFTVENTDTLSYIKPNTISEFIYTQHTKINDYISLKKIIDINLIPEDSKYLFDFPIITKNNHKLLEPSIPNIYINKIKFLDFTSYIHSGLSIDNDFNRYIYLKNKIDYGYTHILNKLPKIKYIKVNEILESLQNQIKSIKIDKTVNIQTIKIIAKEYNSIDDLENDNDKKIYFDDIFYNKIYGQLISKIEKTEDINIIEQYLQKINFQDQNELTFHAKTYKKGRRRVRDGEYAIINYPDKSTGLYIRRTIENKSITKERKRMWIKVLKTPFKICGDSLDNFDDITNDQHITLDSFDAVCKKVKQIKINKELTIIQNKIRYLNIIKNSHNVSSDIIPHLKIYFEYLLTLNHNTTLYSLELLRRPISIKLTKNYTKDYSNFIGDQNIINFDKIFNNIEFGNQYDTLGGFQGNKLEIMEYDNNILNTFINSLDIQITSDDYKLIQNYISAEFTKPKIFDPNTVKNIVIQNILQDPKYKKIFTTLTSNESKNKFISKIPTTDTFKKEYTKKEEEFTKQETEYNKKNIIHTSVWLIITIISKKLLINNITPSCLKYFSYNNFENQTKSLAMYFGCLIKNLSTPDDITFSQFNNFTITEISQEINTELNKIFNKYPKVKHEFDINNKIIKSSEIVSNYDNYKILNNNFKPNFYFNPNLSYNSVIKYLKTITEKIEGQKTLKINIFKYPLLNNSCCFEKLDSNTNYHNYFSQEKFKIQNISIIISTLIPQSKYIKKESISFSKVTHSTFQPLITNEYTPKKTSIDEFKTKNIYFDKDSYIEDYINEPSQTNKLISKLEKLLNNKNIPFDKIKNILNYTDNNFNVSTFRKLLITFLKINLKTILSKLIHSDNYKETYDTNFNTIIKNLKNDTKYDINKLRDVINTCLQEPELLMLDSNEIIKNNVLIIYIILKIFLKILEDNKYDISKEIVSYIIIEFYNFININNCDNNDIKNNIEKLREKYKQQLIAAYSNDEQLRRLQILLKKMGLNIINPETLNKDDASKPEIKDNKDINITEYSNNIQEQSNYNLENYQGNDPEGDFEEPEY